MKPPHSLTLHFVLLFLPQCTMYNTKEETRSFLFPTRLLGLTGLASAYCPCWCADKFFFVFFPFTVCFLMFVKHKLYSATLYTV